MIVTEFEKAEWSRLAQSAYSSDRNDIGHKFSGAAAIRKGSAIPTAMYDELMGIYRVWLVDGLFPSPIVNPEYASSETAYGRTVAYDFAIKVF